MKYHDPLRQILSQTRPHWDRDATRPAVRWAFGKALQCRTAELGGEVYGSESEERTFYHPCKSRPCSSCGYRATMQWQRDCREGHTGADECEIRFAGWGHCHPPHLQRAVKVQLTCPHNGDQRRAAWVV